MAYRGGDEVARPPPPPAGRCPWLVYHHGEAFKNQTFSCDITGPSPVKTYRKSIPALHGGKKVVSCSHGWLVLYDDNTKLLSLCNSTAFDAAIALPRLHHLSDYKIDSCVLVPTSCPNKNDNNNNLKVLIFLENFMSIMYWRLGSEGWSEIRYSKQLMKTIVNKRALDIGPLFFSGAITCGGIIFALIRGDRIRYGYHFVWAIDIVDDDDEEEEDDDDEGGGCGEEEDDEGGGEEEEEEEEEEEQEEEEEEEEEEDEEENDDDDEDVEEEEETFGLVLSRLTVPDRDLCIDEVDFYLLESCGELFLLYFFSETLVFEVYRFNFDSMEWERVERVEDRAFFVGESYCLSCPASGSGRIYFTSKKDPSLFCYYLHDDSVLVSLPCPDLPTPLRPSPSWIMPQVLNGPEDNNIREQGKNCTASTRSIMEHLDENREAEQQPFNLPFDVLEQVSKHLKAMDYMNFRAVSRITRSVAPPVNWRRALSGTNYFQFPLLMFADKDESIYKFVDPSINNSNNYYQTRIPHSLENIHPFIHYSNHGWLILSEGWFGVHLYNPFTGDIVGYTNIYGTEESLFFLSNPSGATHSCSLVCVSFFLKSEVSVSTIDDHGTEYWTENLHKNNRIFKEARHTSPVYFNDFFYFLDRNGNLGRLKIDKLEEDFDVSWEVLDKPGHPPCVNNSILHQNFLLECGGELVSVFIGHLGKWVAVYKLNGNQDWETVTNLGDYNLYLSPASSFSAWTSCQGNRIYFPSLRGSEIIFFSLDTHKWHFSGSQDSSTDFCGTRLLLNSCWIKPSW